MSDGEIDPKALALAWEPHHAGCPSMRLPFSAKNCFCGAEERKRRTARAIMAYAAERVAEVRKREGW